MDQNSENIHDFESLLRNRSSKKPVALYTSSEHKNKLVNSAKPGKVSAKEVLASVSRQVKALQNADTASYKRVGNILDKYKKREFLPVNMMPVGRVVLQKQTKFETQYVTDTQLINVIENAEIVDKNRGVTQEFDKTFCENSANDCGDILNDSRLKPETKTHINNAPEIMIMDRNKVLEEHDGLNDQDSKLFENSDPVTCEMDTITFYQNEVMADFNDHVITSQDTQGFNKCVEIFDVSEEDADRPLSPVLNTNRKSSTPPLVVDLYTFEKFENLAHPIIEEHEDMAVAKNMINSQIIGREVLIPAHTYDKFGRDSPVLSKIDFITTHLNKEVEESICTCSNNCIEKDVKCTNEPTTDHIILTSKNKKIQSKIVTTEIKDEILFSSDEEYEYLHKNIQELPLTCALETSFYDKSDVLDKTMYVGFHTASNKSIQINTDSFTRAKSILSDVGNEGTGTTLSDLVEIFDTSKAVSEHTQSVKVTSNKLECDADNNEPFKIDHIHENLERPSKTVNEFEEKRDDTFKNASLTALERDKEANDDIAMSQIINFRSISNSIMSEGKVSDTFDNVGLTALEQNKDMDDDIMMSQVITFKSITRTPKFAPSVSHESSQLSKVIAKRKLEGFKTASNKKIKLSDKALARCKKIFQDIGLGDSEYESSKFNFAETDELIHEDCDASKTRCASDHTTQEQENYISCSFDSNKMISEDCNFESNLQVKEKQPGIEEVDLQINDQTILQEFEENEMPLEETNNNACVKKDSYNSKNKSDSGVAIAATKNIFQDIISITTTINSESTMNTADLFIDRSDQCEIVFKKPAVELRKAATKRLTNMKSNIPDDDHETCDMSPTEFIGFKTASHKPIIISVQARKKTRDFYRDLDEEITPNGLTEGTINSNTGKKNLYKLEDEFNCGIDTKRAKSSTDGLTNMKSDIPEDDHETCDMPPTEFTGFKTASHKPIIISEQARKKTRDFYRDLDEEITPNGLTEGTINSNTGKKNIYKLEDEFNCGIDTKRAKSSTDGLTNMKSDIPEDDHETCDMPPTEFTGFKTASHKPIIISEQARRKTRDFYRDLDEEITPNGLTEGTINSNIRKKNINKLEDEFNCGIDTQDFLAEELIHIEELFKDNIGENESTSPIFQGFQTASKKAIAISERALEKSKKLFEDITNKHNDFKCHSTKENEQEHNLRSKIEMQKSKDTHTDKSFVNESQSKAHLANSSNEVCQLDDMTNKTPVFTGFQTASKKKVSVSKKGIEATKMLFQDIVLSDEQNERSIRLETVDSNVENPETLLERNNQIFQDILLSDTIQDDFSKENTILSELQPANANSENTNIEAPMLAGFKTSDADRTKNLLKEIKDDDLFNTNFKSTSDPIPSTSRFLGFQTASNKKINISAKALAKSKQLLNDFELKVNNSDTDDCDKEITDNLDSHFEDKGDCFKESDFNNEPCRPSTSKFLGFQTASNKAVNISKEALAKSKQIFQDVDIFDKEVEMLGEEITTGDENSIPVFKGFQTASNKQVSISEKALQNSKKLFRDIENCNFPDNAPVFQGFQTASNKNVNISEKALANSKKLFEDINLGKFNTDPKTAVISNGMHRNKATDKDIIDNVKDTIVSNHENKFEGFQTASNRTVKVSEQALAKTKDIHVEQGNDDSAPVFRGFQTASNKHVHLSEKALVKSKKLFEDINLSQINTDPKTAAQTGIINDIKAPIINNYENKFAGFQTASKKKVTVSDQAMANTRSIFKDIDEENDILLNNKAPVYKGFQTASNKKVAVSEKALAKSKKLFEDINFSQIEDPTAKADLNILQITKTDDVIYNMEEPDNAYESKNNFRGFQTASKKEVKISEQALAKTIDVFKDIHAGKENNSLMNVREIKIPDLKANVNLITSKNNHVIPITSKLDSNYDINRDVIDTQLMNDFENSLNTEDFCKSTPVSKRSGSPILSCPRAKKLKFETPYRTSKKIEPRNVFVPPTLAKTYNFNKDYKKHKQYSLKDVEKLEDKHGKVDIDPYISEFNFDGLLNFVFNGKRNDYTDEKITTEDLKKTFLDSVNKKIVPDGWLDNHIKLITWKLLSYEVKFPNVMKNACTVRNVLEQLKYRYDRELYHVERPILRKILEKDEVPSKTMVLCVAAIYVDNVNVISVPPSSQNVELLLTDGWYCVKACLDRMLIRLVVSGAIIVGTKIAVCGAELINCEQGVAPWEDTSSVRLKLHGNSARRARWRARLGPRADVIPSALGAARADGGQAAVLRLVLTRVYPVLTVERMDGSTVTLSERLENIRQMKYESERQAITEKLYEEVEKEMSDLESQDSEGYSQKGCTDSGSQLAKGMKKSKDPYEYRSHLTKSQCRMLEDHNSRQREKLAERVRERFQEKLQKYGLKTERNVVPLLKVRVADFTEKAGSVEVTKGYLSIWRPSAAVMELVTEGAWIEVLNVIPNGIRNSEIQLSTGRHTVFNPYKQKNEKFKLYANTLQRKCYEIKEIAQNPSMTTDYNEIDTVGMIFCIEPSTEDFHEQSFQNVYLADADKYMICVNFWGGLKKFGYENVLDTGQIITCVNLQKRAGNTRKSIPQYRVTELSYFTKTPKSKKALEMTNELTNKLSKIKDKFCEDCIALKNNYSIFKTRNNENVSPYRFNYNIPKNVAPACDANLNLTGLDFESSFNSQDISPQALLRKRKVNEKIERLRLNYGEPPPLSSIHIINKSKNASATYKSPLLSNLERSKSPLQNVASPVSVNRTFVKNVNPVKLDFSNDLSESVDDFAEDFDASPPLSLDSDVVHK